MANKAKVVIVGAGGMGALFGAILQQGGLDVILLDTNAEHIQAIRQHGLQISGFGGARSVAIPCTTDARTIEQAELLLFQCKSHTTRAASLSVVHLVEGGALCISFQNGLGNEEVIAEALGSEHVLGGLTAMAGYMTGPGQIRDFSRVPSWVGEMTGGVSDRARHWSAVLSAAGLQTHAAENIRHEIWKKLLGNIAMSAVSGVTNMTSAECQQVPALKRTRLRALDEALAVASGHGIPLDREAAVNGMELISRPGGTGDNKSSLCVDILNRRATEVDFIYGSVIRLAQQAGIAVPTLETLLSLVKGIESLYLPPTGKELNGENNEQV